MDTSSKPYTLPGYEVYAEPKLRFGGDPKEARTNGMFFYYP